MIQVNTASSSSSDTTLATGSATVDESVVAPPSPLSREGSPSTTTTKYNRNREMAKNAMNRLEQVRKRAKMQQAMKQVRK